jgi:plastocyanin
MLKGMPLPGRSVLLAAALAGAALGAVPALGARHHRRARLVAVKVRAHGNVPHALATRPPLTGTLSSPTGTNPAPDTTPTTTTPVPTCPAAIGVREGEWFTQPSRTQLCAGKKVTWELDNVGMDDHDLQVLDTDTGTVVATWDTASPGSYTTKALTLPAGTYRIYCTLSSNGQSHDSLGMNAVVTVG